MEVVFTTITLGTNQAFCGEDYYAENMAADEARVQQLFKVRIPHRCPAPASDRRSVASVASDAEQRICSRVP